MAININRVYTRGGDAGKTSLIGGQRVEKDHPRVEMYGTLDELNACLGLVRASLAAERDELAAELDALLKGVQSEVFDLGNELGTPPESYWENMPRATPEAVARLEAAIDRYNEGLEPLKSFVLPAGGPVSAGLHLARTVCRRAERLIVGVVRDQGLEVSDEAGSYINRLSDLLFVLSRVAARGAEDYWEGGFAR